jgi:hypothetical protein
LVLLAATGGCSKSNHDNPQPPATPKEAATQLQQVFATAPSEVRNNINVASEALKTADYEQAIQSLQTIKARQNLTFEQGMAVHQSMVALETRLVSAAAAGDAKARRAYEMLCKSRQN